jgi:peptide/nickel transport system substrate-binding protein
MFKALLRSLITILCLIILIAVGAVNLWQQNSIEKQNLQLIEQAAVSDVECVAGSNSDGNDLGPWSKYSFAFNDPSNLLELDSKNWNPDDVNKGGMLLTSLSSDPKGLNFLTQNGSDVSLLQNYIGIGLMRRHFEDTGRWAPELAYHMARSEDYLIYTFRLRDDIYWHTPTLERDATGLEWLTSGESCRDEHFINNRCRVTAHDLQFMMDMLNNDQVAGAAPLRSYFENLESYRVVDDFTFEVRFTKKTQTQDNIIRGIFPLPEFLYAFDEDGARYDESIIGTKFEAHWYDPNTIGAGPYRFIEFEPGVKIMLERDPRYPLGGNAFSKILFQIINDPNINTRKLRTGELHATGMSPSLYRTEVLEADEDSPFKDGTFGSNEYWSHTYYYIGWNNDSPLFNDKRARQAMSYAFNADMLLKDVMMGLGQRCTGPIPAFLPFYNKELTPYPYDIEKAKSLLAELGWEDTDKDGVLDKIIEGEKVDFEFDLTIYGSSKEYKTIGDIFKEDLAQIGVTLNVQPTEWAMLLKKVDSREFDAVTLAWVSSPDVDFRQIWHSSQADTPQSSNYISFRNEEADKIIEELEVTFDYDKRVELAFQFHQLAYDEQPYTFFYTRRSPYFWRPELENVSAQLVRPYLNARGWNLAPATGE